MASEGEVIEVVGEKRARGDGEDGEAVVKAESNGNGFIVVGKDDGAEQIMEKAEVKRAKKEEAALGATPIDVEAKKIMNSASIEKVDNVGDAGITKTGELKQALFRSQAIAECNFGDMKKVDWMRAARTDKGVSAVGQIVSARLVIDPPGLVERANQHLPKDIRVFGYTRVTSNFIAKQMCDKRRYEYLSERKENVRLQRIEKRKVLELKATGSEVAAADGNDVTNGASVSKASEGEIKTLEVCVETATVVKEAVEIEPEEIPNGEGQVPYVLDDAKSFMLHQIRKLIGTAIAIMRGCVPDSIIEFALRRDNDVNTPMAPELGLFLDEFFYTAYNKKFSNSHENLSQEGYEEQIKKFKHEVIYPHIAATEAKDGTMALWLHGLNDRHYPYFAIHREGVKL
uniref:tRNA pseudouridine synthase n=1 Tax=Physcomitrium patens TaxID=3218 RepID=A0A2K1KFH2_PHYPA|nr:hypothetical protein PHYPA_008902 [Physcomitrium patens]